MWRVGPAQEGDLPAIELLVASVGGDLEALGAEQFLVAHAGSGVVVGCGRLKPYPGFCELASLAVSDEWRTSGVGRAIVTELLKLNAGPVFLICEDEVVDFFRRFGFGLIPTTEMLAGLQSKWERYVAELGHINVMRRN